MSGKTFSARLTTPVLGDLKTPGGRLLLPRDSSGKVVLPRTVCERMLCSGPGVGLAHKVRWEAITAPGSCFPWFTRHYTNRTGKARFALHESLPEQTVLVLSCATPDDLDLKLFRAALAASGLCCGLSPWRPSEYGLFTLDLPAS